jgi:hypothetical protein
MSQDKGASAAIFAKAYRYLRNTQKCNTWAGRRSFCTRTRGQPYSLCSPGYRHFKTPAGIKWRELVTSIRCSLEETGLSWENTRGVSLTRDTRPGYHDNAPWSLSSLSIAFSMRCSEQIVPGLISIFSCQVVDPGRNRAFSQVAGKKCRKPLYCGWVLLGETREAAS